MPTREEIEIAVKVISEVAGEPTVGPVADLIKELKDSSVPAKEIRVTEAKETR
jgi:hypothetical protein